MKTSSELTRQGMLRRERTLAMRALDHYPIRIRRVVLVNQATNLIYRVSAEDGLYALRLVPNNWRTEDNLRAETTWLEALDRDTDLPLPKVVHTTEGESYVCLKGHEGDPERRAFLMNWLPGMLLGRRLRTDNIRKMGELFGKLHRHALSWKPPEDFPLTSFENFLGRGEENALFTNEYLNQCNTDDVEILQTTRRRVETEYRRMDRSALCVIHCDLWHDNIKLFKGHLAPFDFEDTILGYRSHDIAMALLDLAEEVGTYEYESLRIQFNEGYESILPLPEGDVLAFQLGRILWQLNWYARFAGKYFPRTAAFKVDVLRRALKTGRLIDPLKP